MDLLKAMQTFVHVVEAGSLTSAAERTGMSTAMVSNYVRFLEERFACRILQRTTRKQSLTDFGVFFLEKCKNVLSTVGECEEEAHVSSNLVSGKIRLSVPCIYGRHKIMPLISAFVSNYPDVNIEVDVSDRVVHLVEAGFDAAVRIGELSDSNLIAKKLPPYRLVACAAPSYLNQYGAPNRPQQIKDHCVLQLKFHKSSDWHDMQDNWRFMSNGVLEDVNVYGRIMTNDAFALQSCVIAGAGIAILPEVLVSDDIRTGNLIRILQDFDLPTRSVNIVYCADRSMPVRLRKLLDFLRNGVK